MPVFDVDTDEKLVKAVRFSNGILNEADKNRLKLKCYTQKATGSNPTSTSKSIVTAEVDGMTYVGSNFGTTNRFPTNTCDYYMCVHNKQTGKVRVVPAQLFQLEPHIEDKQSVHIVDFSKSTLREKRDVLVKEFGSGRSQRAVKKRDTNKLDEEMVSMTAKTVVESAHTQSQVAKASEEPAQSEMSSTIPPYDKDATKPDDVYKLKDIISAELLSSLTQLSQTFYNCTHDAVTKWREEKKYASFILDKLDTLAVREDARLLQSQCLMYLHCLMHVFQLKYQHLRRKYPFPSEWPIPLKDYILKTFTLEIHEPGNKFHRCVPARMKDLLLSHILVLCLKLSQFDLLLNPVMQDLNIAHKRLCIHVTTLGCTVKKTKDHRGSEMYRAVLLLPLKFPEVRGKAAKKRIF